ncbi:Glycine dehydrogenase (decarboxylating) [termite gut metagenome]|uniref:glycine dehydrogenase (aminomethyl-transferring) n=1 Tax=termite gut metagenome TaxID=433724 RepID=A0A5J4SG29_9ZZZZ
MDLLACRHIGISTDDIEIMLKRIGVKSLDELIEKTIPSDILLKELPVLPETLSEYEYAKHIAGLAGKNKIYNSYIGMGWYNTITPAVIQRNVFENPVWYTSYTPCQAEVSQGRLEALMNFQTVICDLTAMPLANCSLPDEATAAAEAITMMYALRSHEQQTTGANVVFVDECIFPQTLAVINTHAILQGIEIRTGKYQELEYTPDIFACMLQYPNSNGNIENYTAFTQKAHEANYQVAVAADILSLTLLVPPGEWGADIVFGSTQRLGTPLFYGGPLAAYFAARDEYKSNMPGRIIDLSKDKYGKLCYRMALQTREQHIKREKATPNICTSQALLASMAGFYAVYHGAKGITAIAKRIHSITASLEKAMCGLKYKQINNQYFDTLRFELPEYISAQQIRTIALGKEVNLRYFDNGDVGFSIDETTHSANATILLSIFAIAAGKDYPKVNDSVQLDTIHKSLKRQSPFLTHETFQKYHTETEMMRYIKRLDRKDISLTHSMISVGARTMKLNAAAELLPLSRPEFMNIHPLVPEEQATGYRTLIDNLNEMLKVITGLAGVGLQPHSGAVGMKDLFAYGYIRMMGAEGLTQATKIAILNANYLTACLKDTYSIVYREENGFVGHEMILDCSQITKDTGITENDIAKRLMDYGYHAPTLSFPVHGTLTIEPAESESLAELDKFVSIMLNIWKEIQEVKNGEADKADNVLINAPPPEYEIVGNWNHAYSREKAAYPIDSVRENKFWINVARVDNK